MPGIHQIRLIGSRALLIEGSRLVLVDVGLAGSTRLVQRYLDNLGWSLDDIDLIVISHYHIDHMGGLAELRALSSAPVAMHASEVERVIEATASAGPLAPPLLSQIYGQVVEPLRQLVTPPVDVDVVVRDGDALPGCADVRVVHVPGHTRGQIGLHAPRDRWLFVADALQIRGGRLAPPNRIFTEDMPRAFETIERLSRFDVDWLLFSHYGVRSSASDELRSLARRFRRAANSA